MINILTFKLTKLDSAYNIRLTPAKSEEDPLYETILFDSGNILGKDDYILSHEFNNRVKNNDLITRFLSYCKEDDEILKIEDITKNGDNDEFYIMNPIEKDKLCNKFIKNLRSYHEILSRDHDAFNDNTINVQLYPIIVFYKNIYQGHIYAWISPVLKEYCFAMGIRNRPDTIFLRKSDPDKILNNISAYLMEGVRLFALSHNCDYVYITSPTNFMKSLLPKLGFEYDPIPFIPNIIGRSISPDINDCPNCYKLKDINKPIVNDKILYIST